jgi:hypothetical protein
MCEDAERKNGILEGEEEGTFNFFILFPLFFPFPPIFYKDIKGIRFFIINSMIYTKTH